MRLFHALETVIIQKLIIAVPLKLTLSAALSAYQDYMPTYLKSTCSEYYHIRRLDNGSESRRFLLLPFQTSLKSPFSKSSYTVLPPADSSL